MKNSIKKIITSFLIMMSAFSLAGCNNNYHEECPGSPRNPKQQKMVQRMRPAANKDQSKLINV